MIDGGMVESPAVFEFLPATRVLSVAPDVGSELGGGAFVIAGANLAPGGVAKVGTVAPVAARFVSEEAAEAETAKAKAAEAEDMMLAMMVVRHRLTKPSRYTTRS